MKRENSFVPLYATNFLGTLNDNFMKTLVAFSVTGWMAGDGAKSAAVGAVAGALVLPYVVLSPLADRLTAVFAKTRILRLAKAAELPIAALAAAGLWMRSAPLAVAAVLLMGVQSALYSPAKYALVRDIGGEGRISTGMGGMEGVSFLGVMLGTVAASFAADAAGGAGCGWIGGACLMAFAAAGFAASCTVRADETPNRAIHSVEPVRYMRRAGRMAARFGGLRAVVFALSAFWWAAATLQMGLLVYGKSPDGLALGATGTGAMLCGAALGIVAGQVAAGFADARRPLVGAVPAFALAASALLLVLFFAPLSPAAFAAVLAVLAFDLGFFKLPLDAEMQRLAKGPRLNTVLAWFNQVSFLFMLAASGCYALASRLFGPRAFLAAIAAALAAAGILFALSNRKALLAAGNWVFSRRYDVSVSGLDAIPADGVPCLVLPNHPAMVDPMLVAAALRRMELKPLSDESFFRTGLVAPRVLKTLGAVAVPDLRRRPAGKRSLRDCAAAARSLEGIVLRTLSDGGNVIFYPSGHIWTEPREEIGTRQLAYNVCKALSGGGPDAAAKRFRVVGVRTRGLWGSIWSRKGRRSSPPFVPTLAKSVLLWLFYAPFAPRRKVSIHVEDLTDAVREWTGGTRLEFNARLEEWYNAGV